MKKWNILVALTVAGLAITVSGCNLTSASKEKEIDYREQGIELMDAGKYSKAVEMFQTALDQSVGVISDLDIDICYYKAAAQYNAGDVDSAIDTYNSLINYDKKNADAYYYRGTVYLVQGDTDLAAADYDEAISLDTDNYELYSNIYENYKDAGDEDTGLAYLQKALELSGDSTADNREKGYIYYLTGDNDQAVSLLTSAVSAGDEKAMLYLSEIYINEASYSDALDLVNQGLAIEDGQYTQEFLYAEATLYEYMGDFETAKEKMAAYIEAYPDDEAAVRENTFLSTR